MDGVTRPFRNDLRGEEHGPEDAGLTAENVRGSLCEVTIGQYADYLDTGIWTIKDGELIPPPDLTAAQLRDFQRVFGELFVPSRVKK